MGDVLPMMPEQEPQPKEMAGLSPEQEEKFRALIADEESLSDVELQPDGSYADPDPQRAHEKTSMLGEPTEEALAKAPDLTFDGMDEYTQDEGTTTFNAFDRR